MVVTGRQAVEDAAGSVRLRATKKSASENKKASSPNGKEQVAAPQQQFLAQREALRRYINDHGIRRAPPGSRELPTVDGKSHYGWQFYLRSSILRPQHLLFIARCFWSLYHKRYKERPFQIAGVEAASAPIIASILLTAPALGIDLNAFTIRKKRKKSGLRNMLEGEPSNLPVVIIDDLTSPEHQTMWHALNSVLGAGLNLYGGAFVVVFKGRKDGAPRMIPTSRGRIVIESIFTLEDFSLTIEDYQKQKTIGDYQKQKLP